MITELLQQRGLSFERLQSFCLVAQEKGVTKAAKGDLTNQSLYSRQIRELEEFFGTELIRRHGRGISLTQAGSNLYLIARDYFIALSDFKRGNTGRPVEVVIGGGDSIIQWVLIPRLGAIRKRLPHVRFKFLNLPTAEAVSRLTDGSIDFALVREGAIVRPLQSAAIGILGYSLFVPKHLTSIEHSKDGIKALHNLPLATLEGEGNFRTVLADVAKKQKIVVNIQVECSSFPLAARAVAQGEVAAILPTIAVSEFRSLEVLDIPLSFLRRFDRTIVLASNPRSLRVRPALVLVAKQLLELCKF